MRKKIKELKIKIDSDVRECQRYAKKAGRTGEYLQAIQLLAMADAYKRISWDVRKILSEDSTEGGDKDGK